jgi:hypothetical protein
VKEFGGNGKSLYICTPQTGKQFLRFRKEAGETRKVSKKTTEKFGGFTEAPTFALPIENSSSKLPQGKT